MTWEPECQVVLQLRIGAEGILSRLCVSSSVETAVNDYLDKHPSAKIDQAVAEISEEMNLKTDQLTVSHKEAREIFNGFLAAASQVLAQAKPREADAIQVYLDGTRYRIRYEDDRLNIRLSLDSANLARHPSPEPEENALVRWLRAWHKKSFSR